MTDDQTDYEQATAPDREPIPGLGELPDDDEQDTGDEDDDQERGVCP